MDIFAQPRLLPVICFAAAGNPSRHLRERTSATRKSTPNYGWTTRSKRSNYAGRNTTTAWKPPWM